MKKPPPLKNPSLVELLEITKDGLDREAAYLRIMSLGGSERDLLFLNRGSGKDCQAGRYPTAESGSAFRHR